MQTDSIKKTTVPHKSNVTNSTKPISKDYKGPDQSLINGEKQGKKSWKIASITETNKVPEEMTTVMNWVNGKTNKEQLHIQEPDVIPSRKENKKWEIESIHTLGEDDDDDPMTTQVQSLPITTVDYFNTKTNSVTNSDTKFEIEGVSEIDIPEKSEILNQKWDICSINTENKMIPSNKSSVILEDSWVEHHTIPIHSASVQMRTQEYPRQIPVYKITPVSKGELGSRSIFVGNPQIKYPVQTSRSEITIGDRLDEFGRDHKHKSDPADHFSYQYEDAIKTSKLRQLANSNKNNQNNIYNSFDRPIQQPVPLNLTPQSTQWPTTNCMQQSIHVDNDDEEIIGIPLIFDEHNNPIKNLKETKSFNSITENVSFKIHNSTAQMKIEIGVEMFHNTDPTRQMWKRKLVKVTRLVELDLTKVQDQYRLKDIIKRCSAPKTQISWTDKRGLHPKCEKTLMGNDAYQVFYNLMAITHEEENKTDSQESLYLTRSPSGKLTSVICEPQFLLSGAKETQNSTLFY